MREPARPRSGYPSVQVPSHPPRFPRAPRPGDDRPDLLVLRSRGIGDFLTAVPALRALERAHPGHRIHLAAPRGHAELLALAGLDWPLLPLAALAAPPWPRRVPPDLAVNLHDGDPQSIRALRALRPALLWTYAHRDAPASPGPHPIPGIHETEIWCRLLRHYGVPAEGTDLRMVPPPFRGPRPGAAVLHPGAGSRAPRWPERRFAEIARILTGRGHRVVITGSAAERGPAERVGRAAGIDPADVLAGRTTLPEAAALIAGAAIVVCGDSAMAHLATAYSTPSVRILGGVSPARFGPRIDDALHACLWSGGPDDPDARTPGAALLRISTAQVIGALDDLPIRDAAPITRIRPDPRPAPASVPAAPAAFRRRPIR
ncbi:glycosyltransferase family 9 protein [Nocardiopsis mangrovi]|uniref:Glycosyltransferase family 9 protein n=1 Tax=Nocardiopsis mangrovi TaxID=1179818 RepID=A0ABV9DZJ7_9ACTN